MSYAGLAVIEVEGVDGSVWRVHGRGSGVEGVHLGEKPDGIYDAPVRTLWQQGAFQEGASPNGTRWDARDVVFTALIQSTPARSWQEVDSAWRRAWAYDRDSVLRVTTESGTRELRLRMFESPKFTPDHDPRVDEFGELVMTCRAGDPFWHEQPVKTVLTSPGPVTVVNPTDKEMWLRWVKSAGIRPTVPDFDFSGGRRTVTLPSSFTSREILIDTHPLREQIVSPGWANAWEAMGGVQFLHPVPPHTPPTEVPVSWTGSGSLMLVQDRRWSRPWGLE